MIIRKNKAFLLIEVLVTVMVVMASVIFINHAFTSSSRAVILSNDYLSAISLLKDKFFDIELNPPAEEGESSGKTEIMGKPFIWTEDISSLQDEVLGDKYKEEGFDIRKLEYTLRWKNRDIERQISIMTYIQPEGTKE